METIYYGHIPLVYDRQLSKERLEVVLGATQDNRNNIPYIAPLLLTVGPQSPLLYGREIIRACPRRGSETY